MHTETESPKQQAPDGSEPKGQGRAAPPKTGRKPKAPKVPAAFKLDPLAKARLEINAFVMGISQGEILDSLIMAHLPDVKLESTGAVPLGDRLAGVLLDAVHTQAFSTQLPKQHTKLVLDLLATYIARNEERVEDPLVTLGRALVDPRQGRMRLRAALKTLSLRGLPFPGLDSEEWFLIRKVGRLAIEDTLHTFNFSQHA